MRIFTNNEEAQTFWELVRKAHDYDIRAEAEQRYYEENYYGDYQTCPPPPESVDFDELANIVAGFRTLFRRRCTMAQQISARGYECLKPSTTGTFYWPGREPTPVTFKGMDGLEVLIQEGNGVRRWHQDLHAGLLQSAFTWDIEPEGEHLPDSYTEEQLAHLVDLVNYKTKIITEYLEGERDRRNTPAQNQERLQENIAERNEIYYNDLCEAARQLGYDYLPFPAVPHWQAPGGRALYLSYAPAPRG